MNANNLRPNRCFSFWIVAWLTLNFLVNVFNDRPSTKQTMMALAEGR